MSKGKRFASYKARKSYATPIPLLVERSVELGVWLSTETGVKCRLSSADGCLWVEDSHHDALESLCIYQAD